MRFLFILLLLLLSYVKLLISQIASNPHAQPTFLELHYVSGCCSSIHDAKRLLFCSNQSSYSQLSDILTTRVVNPANVLVTIVTYATKNIWDYTAYSLAVNQAYAEHNGYAMIHLDPRTSNYEPKDARWNKVKLLEEAMHPMTGWARDMDYLLWVDADLIFLDMSMRLEQVAAAHPEAHILISAEHAGSSTLVNSGAILVKNSNWSRHFLSDWWSFADRSLHSDQEQFDLLYNAQKFTRQLEKHIAILPPDALNSDPPAMTKQKPYNQVLHLMGEHTAFRIRAFKAAFSAICTFYKSTGKHSSIRGGSDTSTDSDTDVPLALPPSHPHTATLPVQLGVTQEALLDWTIEEYSAESRGLLESYERLAQDGRNGLPESRQLANSVHHYAHALEHRQAVRDADVAAGLRVQVFELLLFNLQQKRAENDAHRKAAGRMLGDWPELLKAVAEAGQHLLQIGDISRRKNVAHTVMGILQELYRSCHRVQRKAVLAMIAHMHSEVGLIFLSDNSLDNAVKHFSISVNISQDLADISGEHLLVNPMSYLANALSMQGKLSESIPIFERIIRISEKHLGAEHESLSQLLVNCGIALVQAGRFSAAEVQLRRALRIMRVHGEPVDSVLCVRARQYLGKAQDEEL